MSFALHKLFSGRREAVQRVIDQSTYELDITIRIARRVVDTEAWLLKHAPDIADEQKHLDDGSPERAYWHYGYLAALKDAIRLLDREGELVEGSSGDSNG